MDCQITSLFFFSQFIGFSFFVLDFANPRVAYDLHSSGIERLQLYFTDPWTEYGVRSTLVGIEVILRFSPVSLGLRFT